MDNTYQPLFNPNRFSLAFGFYDVQRTAIGPMIGDFLFSIDLSVEKKVSFPGG
jgi:hypothetical protein